MIKTVNTKKAPAAIGPYSQAKIANGMVFVSGQIPIDPANGEIVERVIEKQATQVMENIKAILEEANSSFELVVKTTCFISEMKDFSKFNEIYSKYFTSSPARSCVAVKELPKNVLVEVEVIACVK